MFEKVHLGKAVSDIRYLKDEMFDGNNLFARRVLGNPQPENKTLGALVVDSQQADVLAKSLATVKQEFELERQESLIVANMIEAVEQLFAVVSQARLVE